MARPSLTATAASIALAVGGAVVSPAGLASAAGHSAVSAAPAAPRPTPTSTTKTLPVPKATVDPRVSIGGEQLASMGMIVDRPAGVPAPPRLQDVAWLLADLDTGEVIAAKAPHARLLPASTLKTLTALTLIPEVPATQRITATREDASADGTRVGILPGQTYTGEQLFQALLVSSGNDAAYALARAGGGRKATVDAMNAQAARLGAHDTVAVDPSGLDAPGQRSSAYDLALIGRAAMRLPEFRRYVTTKQVAFPGAIDLKTKKRSTFVISNHNRLLYNYEGTLGIKNGFTKAAQRTFISAVRRGGTTYVLTEMYGLNSSWRPQAAMYDWAFAHGSKVTPVGRLVEPGEVPEPPVLPRASAGPAALATSAAGAEPHGTARAAAAAAAVTEPRQLSAALPPWAGLAGLAGTLGLVGALAARAIRRAPRRH